MKPPFLLLMALLAGAAAAGAHTLAPGQSIGIDFGASTSENQFNPCDPNTPGSLVGGALPIVIDTAGVTITGIGVQFAGDQITTTQNGTLQDFSHYSGLSEANVQTGLYGSGLSMTITGLDPLQPFTLDLICAYSERNIGTEFIVNGIHILTDSTSTTGGTLARFTNLFADATGTLAITTLGHDPLGDSRWVGVNAAILTAQAIPEPQAWVLGLLGLGSARLWTLRARRA